MSSNSGISMAKPSYSGGINHVILHLQFLIVAFFFLYFSERNRSNYLQLYCSSVFFSCFKDINSDLLVYKLKTTS